MCTHVHTCLTRLSPDDSEAEPLLLYDVGAKLGAGAFGEVKLAVHKATGEKVAIKTYEKYKVKQYERMRTGNFDDNRPICSEIGDYFSSSAFLIPLLLLLLLLLLVLTHL
jgi:serine/threonine protein kinase